MALQALHRYPEVKTDAHLVVRVIYYRAARRYFFCQPVSVTSVPDKEAEEETQHRAGCQRNAYESWDVFQRIQILRLVFTYPIRADPRRSRLSTS
jgi:hypothetical protein